MLSTATCPCKASSIQAILEGKCLEPAFKKAQAPEASPFVWPTQDKNSTISNPLAAAPPAQPRHLPHRLRMANRSPSSAASPSPGVKVRTPATCPRPACMHLPGGRHQATTLVNPTPEELAKPQPLLAAGARRTPVRYRLTANHREACADPSRTYCRAYNFDRAQYQPTDSPAQSALRR